MDQNIQQNPNKSGMSLPKTRPRKNKKAFAGFYLTLKAHKLKPGQNVTHLKSRPIVTCPCSLLHHRGSGPTINFNHLQNNKYCTFVKVMISAKTYARHNIQGQHNSSQPMPFQCIQTYLLTQPSCLLQNTFTNLYPKNAQNKMKL